jgi:hypothetical protein
MTTTRFMKLRKMHDEPYHAIGCEILDEVAMAWRDRDALRAELERTKGEMEEIKYDLAKFQRSERVVSEMLVERTLDAENLRRLLAIALPHIEASAGAEHLFDGFRPRERPLDATVEEIRAALERKADA